MRNRRREKGEDGKAKPSQQGVSTQDPLEGKVEAQKAPHMQVRGGEGEKEREREATSGGTSLTRQVKSPTSTQTVIK